jgi:hemerythrin
VKKILCFLLTLLLVFNTTSSYMVYAIGFQPSQEEVEKFKQDLLATGRWYEGDDGYLYPKDTAADKLRKFIEHGITVPKLAGEGAIKIAEVLSSFFGNADNYQKNVKTDGQYVYFDNDFTNNINIALQDKVHALDGYYLYEPDYSYTFDNFCYVWNNLMGYKKDIKNYDTETLKSCISAFNMFSGCFLYKPKDSSHRNYYFPEDVYFYLSGSFVICSDGSSEVAKIHRTDFPFQVFNYSELDSRYYVSDLPSYLFTFNNKDAASKWCFLSKTPIKIFYSKQDLNNYLNKGRTYVPQLPSGGFKVNIKYINNTTNLPDITYNINTTNKTEVEIQNEYNTTLNNYLNDLNNFTDGSDNNPTPTPSGGGSGDFGDGSTPTPTPPLGDGGSDQDGDGSDGWLKKIYDQLVKLSDSVSQHYEKEETFEDKLSKYLESHDKKLDAIVDAIDKLSQGKEEGEEKGCKYDYAELSDFMTKLWNDSDQKFDQMVELLKENNEYQEKMLSTLNSIKNILLAQTVMDAFKNRSSETANKAKEKFPTSVPWDIALIVNAMDAEPKAPVFELPIKIERLNIDEKITVDISSGEWEKLAKACRYMLSLLFVLFMVNLTRKLFFSKGDD